MSMVITITDREFDDQVLRSAVPVLVDFSASWCPPCRFMEPVIEHLAEKYSGTVVVGTLDIDTSEATAQRFGVQSIPTLILFRCGNPVLRLVGMQRQAHLEAILDGALDQTQLVGMGG